MKSFQRYLLILSLLVLALVSCTTLSPETAEHLKEKGTLAYNGRQYDSAYVYWTTALALATRHHDALMQGRLNNNLALVAKRKGETETRVRHLRDALDAYREGGDSGLLAGAMINLGQTMKDMQELDSAFHYLQQSVELLRQQPPGEVLGKALSSLGNLQNQLGNHEEAIALHREVLTLYRDLQSDLLSSASNNLGKAYMASDEDSLARYWLLRSLAIKDSLGKQREMASTYYNLCDLSVERGDLQSCIDYAREGMALARRYGPDSAVLCLSPVLVARAAMQRGKQSLAAVWMDSAALYAPANPEVDVAIALVSAACELSVATGNWQKASTLGDSLRSLEGQRLDAERNKRIANMQAAHGYTLLKNDFLRQQNALLRNRVILIAVIAVLLVLLLLFILLRQKRKRDQQARQEAERTASRIRHLLSEMHHRIKNNLSSFAGLLAMEMKRYQDTARQDLIRDNQNRLKAISRLHQQLYTGTETELAQVDLSSYLDDISHEILYSYDHSLRSVDLEVKTVPAKLDMDRAILVGQLLNEALTNALKYAQEEGKRLRLEVHLQEENRQYIMEVRDNGPGMAPEATEGIGSTLFADLSKELGASWKQKNEGGTLHRWQWPL